MRVLSGGWFACESFVDMIEIEFRRAAVAAGLDAAMGAVLRAKLEGSVTLLFAEKHRPAVLIWRVHFVVLGDILHLEHGTAGKHSLGLMA